MKFFFEKNRFRWSKEGALWPHAKVDIKPSSEMKDLASFMHVLIPAYNAKENCEVNNKKEINDLKNMNLLIKEKTEEIIAMKNKLEKELYSKFILILNSKKEKIKDLKNKSNQLPNNKVSKIYEEKTDESGSESDSKNDSKKQANGKNKRSKKEDSIHLKKKKKIEAAKETKIEPVASTSKENKQKHKTLEEEAKDEIELQFEDDEVEETESAINENDSEEMFFS